MDKITRTSRILTDFHIFYYNETVSFEQLNFNGTVSKKTILRDVQLLKRAGLIQVKYSKKEKVFTPIVGEFMVPEYYNRIQPDWPESQSQKIYMEKIIRLCTLMTEMVMYKVENPIEWYRKQYPKLSDRTRQRDFLELEKIDYNIIRYEPESWGKPATYEYIYPQGDY